MAREERGGMGSIVDDPFKAISVLYRKSHVWLNGACAEFGLTAAQAVVILIVCDFGTLTQDGVTKRLGLDKSVVAKTILKLEALGFLERSTSSRDRRTYDIRPTDRARRVYPAVKKQVDRCLDRMTECMDDVESAEFRRLLLLAANSMVAQGD